MSFIGSDKKSSHRRLKILRGRLSLQDVIIETKNYNEPVYILTLFLPGRQLIYNVARQKVRPRSEDTHHREKDHCMACL